MIIEKNAANFIDEGLLAYSSYVATSRALISVADGLKPIQRKILWAMWKMKATNFTKSANVSGEVFKYSAHGDSYLSLVNMAQKDGNLIPLISGKGSFGNRTSRDIAPASSRYTESKLSPLAVEVMKNISDGGVEMIDNYDGSRKMPKYLAFDFPFALLAANQGIAVGLASNTFSYNLKDICQATRQYIAGEKISSLIPDFSTGGEICQGGKFSQIHETGSGQITLHSKCEVEKQTIVITEIPYYTTREQMIDAILKKVRDKVLPEIKSVLDLSGLKGMRIEIELKKGVNAEQYLEKLFALGLLSTKTTANMMMLNLDNKPELMSIERVIEQWVTWKRESVKSELMHEREQIQKKLYTLSAIEAMSKLPLEDFIQIMRFTSGNLILATIAQKYAVDETQAKYLATLPMSALNRDILQVKLNEVASHRSAIQEIERKLGNLSEIDLIILERLNKAEERFGESRRTLVTKERIGSVVAGGRKSKTVLEPEKWNVVYTKQGFLNKYPEKGRMPIPKLATDDEIVFSGLVSDEAYLLSFDEIGSVTKHYFDNFKLNKGGEIGSFVSHAPSVVVSEETKFIIVLFEDGKMLKVGREAFDTKTRRKSLSMASKGVLMTMALDADCELVAKQEKREYSFNTADVRTATGASAGGILPCGKKGIVFIDKK